MVGDSEDRPMVALLVSEEVDSSSDSACKSPLLSTALYAVDILGIVYSIQIDLAIEDNASTQVNVRPQELFRGRGLAEVEHSLSVSEFNHELLNIYISPILCISR